MSRLSDENCEDQNLSINEPGSICLQSSSDLIEDHMREDGQKTLMRPRVTVAQVSTWKRFHCVNIHPFASGAGSMNFAKLNEPSGHQLEDSKDATCS